MLKTVGFPSTRTGDQTIVSGNLVIGTAGKGIDFSAATHAAGMTSELLNDYEEGTFTPFSYGTTSAGAGTYSSQIGKYTKIGNCVYFQIYIVQTAHTGTGNMRIGGLPFNSSSTSNLTPASSLFNNLATAASTIPVAAVTGNGNWINLYTQPVGGGGLGTIAVDVDCSLIFSGSYVV
jgi:hypothetical protein